MQSNLDDILAALANDKFRAKFCLADVELAYVGNKGLAEISRHAHDLLLKRLAPENIPNDGKQTPWRGHPVFIAQHATGTCCRGCLAKWHKIPKGEAMTAEQLGYAVSVIMAWIERQTERCIEDSASAPLHCQLRIFP